MKHPKEIILIINVKKSIKENLLIQDKNQKRQIMKMMRI